jgi:predicted nucleic acid-binding protein
VIVVDASAVVDLVAGIEPSASWVDRQVAGEAEVHGPELIDPEVVHALRGRVTRREVTAAGAREAIDDLLQMPLLRYPHRPFVRRIWDLRGQLSAYDATYVALAEALGARLVTTDLRLARAATTVEVAGPGTG